MKMFLFTTDETDLKSFFDNIDDHDIMSCFDFGVYKRGEEYYDDGCISEISYFPGFRKIEATVEGNFPYHVSIEWTGNSVVGTCDCPYDGPCKHIVAVLLFARNEKIEKQELHLEDSFDKADYLKNLEKEELIRLVEKYVPKSYFDEVRNRSVSKSKAEQVFKKVEKKILGLFNDDELMYDPSDFEASLMAALEKLKGFEKQLRPEISELIIKIMEKVNEAFDEGYLYIDSYPEEYFESDDFDDFVLLFVSEMDVKYKLDYLNELSRVLDEMSYSTFDGISRRLSSVVGKNESKETKSMLLESLGNLSDKLAESLYLSVKEELNLKEKEQVLKKIVKENEDFLIELAELYESQKNDIAAIKLIEYHIANNSVYNRKDSFFIKLLELYKKNNYSTINLCLQAISSQKNVNMLKTALTYHPQKRSEFEQILEKERKNELLDFYDSEGKAEEGLALIKRNRWSDYENHFRFMAKYKKSFPSEAASFFINEINNNLEEAKEWHYKKVAESLMHLKQVNPTKANELKSFILINYKRRRNLVLMINKI